jgi:glycogen(starch) synthase
VRVLVLSNLYPPDVIGGYEIACRQASDCLRRRGHEVLVLTSVPRSPVGHEPHVRRTLRLANIWDLVLRHSLSEAGRRLDDVAAAQIDAGNVHQLIATLAEFSPDVVYVGNVIGLGGLGLIACLQHLRVPWVWHLGDNVPQYLCAHGGRIVPELARQFGRQFRGRYLACSSRLVEQIEDKGISLGDNVEVVPYWVVGARPAPRERYFQKGETLRVVSAGRVVPEKGIDLLIEAFGILRAQGCRNISLDIYGSEDGVDPTHYPSLIEREAVGVCVALKGAKPQAELHQLYDRYDVFAFPTWDEEPFGIAPLEAAARGCVPLISEDCGLAEWLVHGAHCVKTERSAAAIARGLRSILNGQIDVEPIGRRVAVTVWRDFHLETIAPRIERALAEAAAGQSRDGARSAAEVYRLALLAEKFARSVARQEKTPETIPGQPAAVLARGR